MAEDCALDCSPALFATSSEPPTAVSVLTFLRLTLSGSVIIYSLWIALISLTFWFTKFDNNVTLMQALMDTGRFPSVVYPAWLRIIVTFVVPIADVSNPRSTQFLSLVANGMTQTMRFKPNDNLRFSVKMPNGELFNVGPDTQSPLAPDPAIQISAVFSIKRAV